MNEELLNKARAAKSPEELLKLAQENGMSDFNEESAKAYFDIINKSGELADDELEQAAGGCKKGGKTVVTHLNRCDEFVCKYCGRNYVRVISDGGVASHGYFFMAVDCDKLTFCCNCKFCIYEGGLWLCNNAKHNAE